MQNAIIGTAGHIDHGKTTLVRVLTGIDTDRLLEEKQRGITIDIGFAHKTIGDFRVGFVDVPGHEKFVKNMLAGIGGIHLLMLTVAADESVMPQTREHFDICKLLGIPRGIVVITKCSTVDAELVEIVREEVRELVKGSFLESAPVVAVDSVTGEGIDRLSRRIEEQLQLVDQERLNFSTKQRVFVLPIDRVFSIRGFGTVITGTALSGSISQDQTVTILPSRKTAKIRGIEIFGEKSARAEAGQRTALNLTGIDKSQLNRGMFLVQSDTLESGKVLDAQVQLLPSAPGPFKHRTPIRFHHGSAEIIGRIYLPEDQKLDAGETGFVQIRLEEETVCLPGDRFILRRYSPLLTVAGGLVIDSKPPRRKRREVATTLRQLKELASEMARGEDEKSRAIIRYALRQSGIDGQNLQQLRAATGLTIPYLLQILGSENQVALVKQDSPLALNRSAIEQWKDRVIDFLKLFHQRKPLAQGVPKEELKKRFLRTATPAHFQFLIQELESSGQVKTEGSSVQLAGASVTLTDKQKDISRRLLETLRRSRFQPPGLERLVRILGEDEATVREIFFYLIEQGELLRVAEDFVIPASQLEKLTQQIREAFPKGTVFSVPQFKELLSISRKYAIPILEFLDRARVTRRIGDGRQFIGSWPGKAGRQD